MWFKNAIIFNLTHPFRISAESLDEKMQERSARKCGPLEMSTIGWTPVISAGDDYDAELATIINAAILIACKKTEKILPASVVREKLAERIEEIEHNESREVRNKEKMRLRDEITVELLPQAFTRSKTTYALIDPANQRLLIDTASRPRAEELTVLLRETLGSLEITNPETKSAPSSAMTQWLYHNSHPSGFTIGDNCIIEDHEDSGQITCRNIDITQTEIRHNLIGRGARIKRMEMTWNDRLSFNLDQDFTIRSIKPLDVIDNLREENDDVDAEALFRADLILFMAEINGLLERLFEVLGGES